MLEQVSRAAARGYRRGLTLRQARSAIGRSNCGQKLHVIVSGRVAAAREPHNPPSERQPGYVSSQLLGTMLAPSLAGGAVQALLAWCNAHENETEGLGPHASSRRARTPTPHARPRPATAPTDEVE